MSGHLKNDNQLLYSAVLLFCILVSGIYFSEIHGQREAKILAGEIFIFALMIYALCKVSTRQVFELKLVPATTLLLLFFSFSLLSTLGTENWYWSYLGILKWSCYLIAFMAPLLLLDRQAPLRPLLYGPVLTACLAGAFGIVNYYGIHFDPVIHKLVDRARIISTFGNQNYLSAYLAPTIPLAIYCTLKAPTRHLQLLFYTAYTVTLTALLYAKTRGTLIGLIAALAFSLACVFFSKGLATKVKEYKRPLLILSLITILLFTIFGGQPPGSSFKGESMAERLKSSSSLETRYMMWNIAADMAKSNPATGIGLGAFGYSYPKYQGDYLAKEENILHRPLAGWAHNAHNEYLQIAAESGLLTLALFVFAIGLILLSAFKSIGKTADTWTLTLTSAIIAMLVHSLVSFPLRLMPSAMLFWLLLGLLTVRVTAQHDKTRTISIQPKAPLKLVLIPLLGLFLFSSSSFFISDRYLGSGIRLLRAKSTAAASQRLDQALAFNPWNGRAREQLGISYKLLGKTEDADRQLKSASDYAISEILFDMHAKNSFAANRIEESLSLLKTGLYYYPNHFSMRMNLGVTARLMAEKLGGQNQNMKGAYLKLALLQLESAKALYPGEQGKSLEWVNYNLSLTAQQLLADQKLWSAPVAEQVAPLFPDKGERHHDLFQATRHNGILYQRDFILGSPEDGLPTSVKISKLVRVGEGWLREYSPGSDKL